MVVRQERALSTRQAIIRGAAEVFEAHGYVGASLQDIVVRSGTTKGSLYFHFASKEVLAHAVIQEQHAKSFGARQDLLASPGTVIDLMVAMCRQFGEQLQSDPIVRAGIRLTLEASTFEKPVVSPYTAWMNEFEALIRRGVESGEVSDSIDPAALARFIIPAFTGVQMVSEVLAGRTDLRQRIDEMWLFVLPALRP